MFHFEEMVTDIFSRFTPDLDMVEVVRAELTKAGTGRNLPEIELVEVFMQAEVPFLATKADLDMVRDLHRSHGVEQMDCVRWEWIGRYFGEIETFIEQTYGVFHPVGLSRLTALDGNGGTEIGHRHRLYPIGLGEVDHGGAEE